MRADFPHTLHLIAASGYVFIIPFRGEPGVYPFRFRVRVKV